MELLPWFPVELPAALLVFSDTLEGLDRDHKAPSTHGVSLTRVCKRLKLNLFLPFPATTLRGHSKESRRSEPKSTESS